MDSIQDKVAETIGKHRECLKNRTQLKGLLSDCLMEDRIHINLLLNAYDDGFADELESSGDISLKSIRMIKTLVNNYGISEVNAKWSVETWCKSLGYNEIADALMGLELNNASYDSNNKGTETEEDKEYELHGGIYCAGVDFPYGMVVMDATWDGDGDNTVFYGKSKSVDDIPTKDEFSDRTYFQVEKGDFVKLKYYGFLLSIKAKRKK